MPPLPTPGVLVGLLHDMSKFDPGNADSSPHGAPSQHKATEAPALPKVDGEKQQSEEEENDLYAPALLIVQPTTSNTGHRKCQTSTTPTQAQDGVASNQQTKTQEGEKQDDAAVLTAANVPSTQTRKKCMDALY